MSEDSNLELIANAPKDTLRDGNGKKLRKPISLDDGEIEVLLRSKIGKRIGNPHTAPTIKLCLVRGAKKPSSDRYIDFSASMTFDVSHNFDRLGKKANDQEGIRERLKFTRITKEAEIDEFLAVTKGYLSSPGRIEITLPDGLTGAAAYSKFKRTQSHIIR